MMYKKLLLSALVLGALSGCAGMEKYSGTPGDIYVGGPAPTIPPISKRAGPDGNSIWEYNDEPWGDNCYLVTVSPQNTVLANVQPYTDANLARIQPGMTIAQVESLMCKVHNIENFARDNYVAYDWLIELPGPMGPGVLFNVYFRGGTVWRTERVNYVSPFAN